MKKIKIAFFVLFLMVVPLFTFTETSHAGSFHSGDTVIVKKNEVVDHTLFVAGNNVEIDGTIKGDVFCAGQNISINATVEGDVICAGMNVQVGGSVLGNVRLAGETITLSAAVNRNASLIGNSVSTDSNSKIGGDMQSAGNTLTLNGAVSRDADIAGKFATVDGSIGRDLQAASSNLHLENNAKIVGNLTYYSNDLLQKADGSQIGGTVTRKQPPQAHENDSNNSIMNILFSFVMLLTLALVLLALFPSHLKKITETALTKPGMTVLIGLLSCIIAPILIVTSFLTVIGAFVGILLLFTWIIIMMLSSVFASYYAGRLVLMRSSQHPFIVMTTGVILVSILMIIPIINILTIIAMALFGSGMIVRHIIDNMTPPRYENLAHPTNTKKKAA